MSEDIWTIQRLLVWTTGFFEKKNIDAPRRTAEILLSYVLKLDRVHLYMDFDRPLSDVELKSFKALILRRVTGVPTDYLTGTKSFLGRDFQVDERVLVPRPETEQLVMTALSALPPRDATGDALTDANETCSALDLCTGSGCVAVSIALEHPQSWVMAVDVSEEALKVAASNAGRLGVSDRVAFQLGDLFSAIPKGQTFHVIASNPPYVCRDVIPTLSQEVQHEPHLALDGGVDGLDLIRRIAAEGMDFLKPDGLLCLEIGEDQGEAVREILTKLGWQSVRVDQDFAGLDRIVSARKPSTSEITSTECHLEEIDP